jgi:hypothetical protein
MPGRGGGNLLLGHLGATEAAALVRFHYKGHVLKGLEAIVPRPPDNAPILTNIALMAALLRGRKMPKMNEYLAFASEEAWLGCGSGSPG